MARSTQNSRPTATDVARRLIILKHIVVSAVSTPPREMLAQMMSRWGPDERTQFQQEAEKRRDALWRGLREAGWWQHLSPHEQEHAQTTMATMTQRQHINASWRMEAAQTLMWALGLLPVLPSFDTKASPELLKQIPSRDVAAFVQSARLVTPPELDRARNDAELWHWRSRTRQLIEQGDAFPANEQMKAAGFNSYDDVVRFTARKAAEQGTIPPCIGDDFPVEGKAYRDLADGEWAQVRSITMERHFALNWLCGFAPENKWDETPTGT